MPAARRTTTIAAAVLLLAGCSGDQDPGSPPDPSIPLASYATEGLSVARSDFCEQIDADAVKRALGAEAARTDHYGNGDSVELSPGLTDIAHEYNCTFTSAEGVVARGWVFAPPITAARAEDMVRRSLKADGCTPLGRAAPFGDPTVATLCRGPDTTSVTFRGLFIDAWLNCSVSTPLGTAEALLDRADKWCVSVAQAAHGAFIAKS